MPGLVAPCGFNRVCPARAGSGWAGTASRAASAASPRPHPHPGERGEHLGRSLVAEQEPQEAALGKPRCIGGQAVGYGRDTAPSQSVCTFRRELNDGTTLVILSA